MVFETVSSRLVSPSKAQKNRSKFATAFEKAIKVTSVAGNLLLQHYPLN